jgi:hypothetical protein
LHRKNSMRTVLFLAAGFLLLAALLILALTGVYWSLSEPAPPTPLDLFEEVQAYANDVGVPDSSSVLRTSLPFADLIVHCRYDVRDKGGEWIELTKQHRVVGPPGQLTGADLLWEIHVAFAGEVSNSDKHFFEGLEFMRMGEVPVYELVLGS